MTGALAKNPWYYRMRGLIGALVLMGIVVASLMQVAFSPCVFLRLGPLTLACPLGTLEVTFAGRGLIWDLVPGFIILCLLIAFLGRMWCGWVCPAHLAGHAVGNACSFLAPGASKMVKADWRKAALRLCARLQPGRMHLLGFVVGLLIGAYIFQYPFWSIICPLGVISRALIEGVVLLQLRWDLLFLILPILGALLFRFGWKCACPVGLVYGAIATPNRTLIPALSLTPEKSCNECRACRTVCPTGLYPAKEMSAFDCTKCLRCVESCPHKALSVQFMPAQRADMGNNNPDVNSCNQ